MNISGVLYRPGKRLCLPVEGCGEYDSPSVIHSLAVPLCSEVGNLLEIKDFEKLSCQTLH